MKTTDFACRRICIGVLVTLVVGQAVHGASEDSLADGPATVLWISIDGLRADYIDRAETPFFDRMREEGMWSKEVVPPFPSVTFTGHVSQATGVTPDRHGVTGNTYYDNRTGELYRYPPWQALVEAEPIWITAERQGARAAVLDWPQAHAQEGEVTASHFHETFTPGLSDAKRLERLLDLWESDEEERPLRLMLGYVSSIDGTGHQYGPDSSEVVRAAEKADRLLEATYERALRLWKKTHADRSGGGGSFFLLVTSDHGMSPVHTLVHPEKLAGLEGRAEAVIAATGSVAHIHFDRIREPAAREKAMNEAARRIARFASARVFRRNELPERWRLAHPHRTGDLFVVLDRGFAFSRRASRIQEPVGKGGEPRGMHGYDPAENAEMLTPMFLLRMPRPLGGRDLGRVDARRLHATVAEILGIEPAPDAADGILDHAIWIDPHQHQNGAQNQ